MTDPLLPLGDGQTEISEEDRQGLIPTYISTRGELWDAEEAAITKATFGLSARATDLADDLYLRRLHRRMFADVWRWAGQYRIRETNLGVAPEAIAGDVRALVGDVDAWLREGTFEADELAIRFHHRLVKIHPFVNGNGRHGRIAADLLVVALGERRFSWGARLQMSTEDLRHTYHQALRRADADGDDIGDLIAFARS
ncbi:MAG TPA: mobile mystery protein B [Acidimicrobiales bacterium]|nr:mobile mystery protein B [Acidimicrobiales bacterium]